MKGFLFLFLIIFSSNVFSSESFAFTFGARQPTPELAITGVLTGANPRVNKADGTTICTGASTLSPVCKSYVNATKKWIRVSADNGTFVSSCGKNLYGASCYITDVNPCPVGQTQNLDTAQCEAACELPNEWVIVGAMGRECMAQCPSPKVRSTSTSDCVNPVCTLPQINNDISGACQTPPTCVGQQTYVNQTNSCAEPVCSSGNKVDPTTHTCVLDCIPPATINPYRNMCDHCVQGETRMATWYVGNEPVCIGSCTASVGSSIIVSDSGQTSQYGSLIQTGGFCDTSVPNPPSTDAPPNSEIPPDSSSHTCPSGQTYGVFNGVAGCYANGTSKTNTYTESTNTSTIGNTTTTTTQTTNSSTSGGGGNSGTTTTTTTVTTLNPDGTVTTSVSGTTTGTAAGLQSEGRTASGGSACISAPICSGDAIDCKIVEQQWLLRCSKQVSDPGNCSIPFSCDGDAHQCAVLRLAHNDRCLQPSKSDVQNQIVADSEAEGLVSMGSVIASQKADGYKLSEEVDLGGSAHFGQIAASPTGSCPADLPIALGGHFGTVSVPLSEFCTLFTYIGYLVSLSAVLAVVKMNYQALQSI